MLIRIKVPVLTDVEVCACRGCKNSRLDPRGSYLDNTVDLEHGKVFEVIQEEKMQWVEVEGFVVEPEK